MAARDYGQYDGVTRGLELVGERWALLPPGTTVSKRGCKPQAEGASC